MSDEMMEDAAYLRFGPKRKPVNPHAVDVVADTTNPLTCPKHRQPWGTVYRDGSIDYQCGCKAPAPVAPKPTKRPTVSTAKPKGRPAGSPALVVMCYADEHEKDVDDASPTELRRRLWLAIEALSEAADGLSRAGRPRLARRACEVVGTSNAGRR